MQSVLITGANRGLGRATAKKFLSEGYRVIGTSTPGTADYSHENLSFLQLDLRSPESIAQCAGELATRGERFDIVLNNAGALFDEDDSTLIPEKLRQTLEVNLIGTADFTEQVLPLVNRGGHIVMLSSRAGSIERTGQGASRFPGKYPAYKIAKAALNMYMRTLAMRLKDSEITVSCIHPGWVKTDMGGEEAEITPEEAGENIYSFAITRPETGLFWFNGEQLPW